MTVEDRIAKMIADEYSGDRNPNLKLLVSKILSVRGGE